MSYSAAGASDASATRSISLATDDGSRHAALAPPPPDAAAADDVGSVRSSLSRLSQLRPPPPRELSEPLTGSPSGGGGQDDPYYVFRGDLYRKLEAMDEGLAEFLRVVHQTDTAVNTHELKETKRQLKRHIKNAEATLKDLYVAVGAVESDRGRFRHVSDAELYDRRSLLQTSRDRIGRARQDMQSDAVRAKLLADERARAARRAGDDRYGAANAAQQAGTDAILDSQARTSLLMEHQEETLEVLDAAVGRVSEMAGMIHEEIGQQNKMLTEMEEDLSNVEEELGLVMGKLAKFLKTKDTWQLKTIIILSLIVVFLFMLVLYS